MPVVLQMVAQRSQKDAEMDPRNVSESSKTILKQKLEKTNETKPNGENLYDKPSQPDLAGQAQPGQLSHASPAQQASPAKAYPFRLQR